MDFEQTRIENDEQFLTQLDSIKSAENIKVLIPFAKAYLGMFYVIDHDLPAKQKVRLLAKEALAEAIFHGFISSLQRDNLPAIEEIGHKSAVKQEYAEGYVVLAGLDLIAKNNIADIETLDLNLIKKAVAFHFSNQSSFKNIWFDYLLEKDINKVIPAICEYWVAMLKNETARLPGNYLLFGDKANSKMIEHCILPLLRHWRHCKIKTLSQLLSLAFKYSEAGEFLAVCENALAHDELLNEKTRLYWIITAYLISPEKYYSKLSNYVGRVKLKIMPLLDFVILILSNKEQTNIQFNARVITELLRIIAPVFPPQHHVYGALGALDINSRNVMMLFYYLVNSNEKDIAPELKKLRKARVMKIYSPVIDNVLEIQIRKHNEVGFVVPDFDKYIESLVKNNCLQGRSNKFDLR